MKAPAVAISSPCGSSTIRIRRTTGSRWIRRTALVVMTDENRSGVLTYERTSGGDSAAITEPKRHIFGPDTNMGFMAGVTLDPQRREIYAVSNDGGGLSVFPYDGHGNVEPIRRADSPAPGLGAVAESQARRAGGHQPAESRLLRLSPYRDRRRSASAQRAGAALPARRPPRRRPRRCEQRDRRGEPRQLDGAAVLRRRRSAGDGQGLRARQVLPALDLGLCATADGDVPPVRDIQGTGRS